MAAAEACPATASRPEQAMDTALWQLLVQVQVQQVPVGHGTRATRERRERRIRWGNPPWGGGWRLRGPTMPATVAAAASTAAAPMLAEDSDGDGGAALRRRPREGPEAPG